VIADIAGEHGRQRRADAGSGPDDTKRQIESSGSARDVGDHDRHDHREDRRRDAVEQLRRDQEIGIGESREQQAADCDRGEAGE